MQNNPLPPPPKAILTQKNLLDMIHAFVGSPIFKNFYLINHEGKEVDASGNGNLSCARVVSGILVMNDLMERIRATVPTAIADMESSGWLKTNKPVPGSVIHWGPGDPNGHEHLGFYIDEHTTMTNSAEQGIPVLQGMDMPDGRQPLEFFTHPYLPIRHL